jgi:TRAP-type C4-dicarboxylate transport system substrate-binding protein
MRIARRTLLASAAAYIAAPAVLRNVLSIARADMPQIVLKLHHAMSSVSSAHDKFIVPWARKVQAESGNRIRIDIFPSMQLGGAPARLFDQVRDGDADIVWTAPMLTPGRFPRIEMFDLPFVPSRRALVSSKALTDFAAANLKDEFRDVRPLCFSCTDRAALHTNQPIRTVEDIKDLKVHVPTRWAAEALHVLGAQPVPMPPGQLQMALNTHVIDGCLDPWHLMPALRLNDVLKMHTEFSDTSPSSTTFVLAMNNAAYDRLPRDLKSVIDANSGQAAATMAGTMWDLEAASVADTVVRGGDSIVTLLPEAVAHWRKLTEPVVEKWLKEMKEQKTDGGKLIAAAHALLLKYAKEPEPQPPQPLQQQPAQQTVPQQDAVTQPPQSAAPPQTTQTPPQIKPQPAPQTSSAAPAKINAPAPATTASVPPANATPSALPAKPAPPQPPAPKFAKPAPPSAPPSAAAPAAPAPAAPAPTIAKPVAPAAAPQIATPAPAPMPAQPSAASIAPAAKPAAAIAPSPPAPAPPPPAAPAPPVATVAPAAKPAAAPVIATPPAAAPATAAAPPPPVPKAAPHLDIPL